MFILKKAPAGGIRASQGTFSSLHKLLKKIKCDCMGKLSL